MHPLSPRFGACRILRLRGHRSRRYSFVGFCSIGANANRIAIPHKPVGLGLATSFLRSCSRYMRSKGNQYYSSISTMSHHYRQLNRPNEIRILEVRPGELGQPLDGKLHHVILSDEPDFEALSYVWGSEEKPFEINTPDGMIPLTSSLHSALTRLRKKSSPLLIWADAICINQMDNVEKGSQVRMMRDIYESAHQAIIYLGEEFDDSHAAIQTLLQLQFENQPTKYSLPKVPATWVNGAPAFDDSAWLPVRNLLKRSYFGRAWIVQELVVSSHTTLVCGRWEVQWHDFASALCRCLELLSTLTEDLARTSKPESTYISFVHQHPQSKDMSYIMGLAATKTLYHHGNRDTMLNLLHRFEFTKATRARDHIYALLGLASDGDADGLAPDYEAPIEVIVRRCANVFVKRGLLPTLLDLATPKVDSARFPSWVPDWTVPSRIDLNWAKHPALGREKYNASHLNMQASYNVENDWLEISGLVFDIIDHVSVKKHSSEQPHLVPFLKEAMQMVFDLKRYPTGESVHNVGVQIPIGNFLYKSTHKPLSQNWNLAHEVLTSGERERVSEVTNDIDNPEYVLSSFAQGIEGDGTSCQQEYNEVVNVFCSSSALKRCVTTRTGYAGMVPEKAEAGDLVCTFDGCHVPYVLRLANPSKAAEEPSIFRFIGHCYIHGIMHGDAGLIAEGNEMVFLIK